MKAAFIALLVVLVLGNGLQLTEENLEENESQRRELIVITGPAILAACISGAVGGIIGAASTAGINACAGKRDKTVVIVREADGSYRQERPDEKKTRRELQGGGAAGAAEVKPEVINGVTFGGQTLCPADGKHTVAAMEQHADGVITIAEQYFSEEDFNKLDSFEQQQFSKLTPRGKWRSAISQVIAQNRAKKAAVVNQIRQEQAAPKLTRNYLEIGSATTESSSMPKYLPHAAVGVALLLLGALISRTRNNEKTYVYSELVEPL